MSDFFSAVKIRSSEDNTCLLLLWLWTSIREHFHWWPMCMDVVMQVSVLQNKEAIIKKHYTVSGI